MYDGLENGEMNMDDLLSMLPHCVPSDSETIAGYKVYATDATANEHEQAETLPDRSVLKSNQKDPIRYTCTHRRCGVVTSIHGWYVY